MTMILIMILTMTLIMTLTMTMIMNPIIISTMILIMIPTMTLILKKLPNINYLSREKNEDLQNLLLKVKKNTSR